MQNAPPEGREYNDDGPAPCLGRLARRPFRQMASLRGTYQVQRQRATRRDSRVVSQFELS
jgi:hypothetical protein